MSPFIHQPTRLLKHIRELSALGADARSRDHLARGMFRANLKRSHQGWSSLVNRFFGAAPVQVQLRLPLALPFVFRPGTTDLLVLEQVFLDREYHVEPLPPESIDYIVDLGSNIGVTAMLWAQRYPSARMVLVEPDPDNFNLLRRNTAAFRDRCVLLEAAVSDRPGRTSFFKSQREYGHSILRTDDCLCEIQVTTMTVPEVLRTVGFPRVDLLKMDIEGGEQLVMPTIPAWKPAPHHLIAELHPPYDVAAFTAHCSSAGLEVTRSSDAGVRSNLPFATRAASLGPAITSVPDVQASTR